MFPTSTYVGGKTLDFLFLTLPSHVAGVRGCTLHLTETINIRCLKMEEIAVKDIIDPATFWFVSAGDKNFVNGKENQLSNFIQTLDKSSEGFLLESGLLVAVKNPVDSKWQRGEIQSCSSPLAVHANVFLLDHGIVKTVERTDIRKLPGKFCSDFFALKLRLSGLVCNDDLQGPEQNDGWHDDALSLVNKLLETATSCYFDADTTYVIQDTVFADLYVKVDGALISVSEKLIERGFAVKAESEESKEKEPAALLDSQAKGSSTPVRDHQIAGPSSTPDDQSGQVCGLRSTQKSDLSTEVQAQLPLPRVKEEPKISFLPAGISFNSPRKVPVQRQQHQSQTFHPHYTKLQAGQVNLARGSESTVPTSSKATSPCDTKGLHSSTIPKETKTELEIKGSDICLNQPKSDVSEGSSLQKDSGGLSQRSRKLRERLMKEASNVRPVDSSSEVGQKDTATGVKPCSSGKSSNKHPKRKEKLIEPNGGVQNSKLGSADSSSNFGNKRYRPADLTHGQPVLMNEIIAHSKDGIPESITDMKDAYFTNSIHKVLANSQPSISRLQRYTWPAILRGDNVLMIEPPTGNINSSFLVPLLNRLLTPSSAVPEGNGPLALILCPGAESGEEIMALCNKYLNPKDNIRVILTHGGGAELEKVVDLTNGCEILISTPPCFLRLVERSTVVVNLKRLCHLVLHKADMLCERFERNINTLLYHCKFEKNRRDKRDNPNPVEILATSEKWSSVLYEQLHGFSPYPLVCINSHFEAAIYANVRPKLDILNTANKPQKVLDIVKENQKETVIVCHDADKAEKLAKFVTENGIYVLVAHEKHDRSLLCGIRNMWRANKLAGRKPVLICTDVILQELEIDDAACLVHYDLPLTKTLFGTRFSCLMKNIPNINKVNNANLQRLVVHILLDQENRDILPGLVNFMERLKTNIIPILKKGTEEVLRVKETKKSNVPLCKYLKAFGKCWKKGSCSLRHAVLQKDCQNDLPSAGRVRLKILTVLDASCFAARMLDFTNPDGSVQTFRDDYVKIAFELALYFNVEANRKVHGNPQIGDICAVSLKDNVYQRARVDAVSAVNEIGQPTSVTLNLIDNGNNVDCPVIKLLYIPESLQNHPTQVVEVYLCNVAPADLDVTWSTIASKRMKKWFHEADSCERYGSYVVGDIKLSLGNTLWLDPVQIKRSLTAVETDVTCVSIAQEMVKQKLAVKNHDHLQRLYALCRESGLNNPVIEESVIAIEPSAKKVEMQLKPQWAHLWEDESFGIIFLAADNPGQLFVRQYEFDKNLKNLTASINSYANARVGQQDVLTIKQGVVCLGKSPDPPKGDGLWNRAIVTGIADNKVELFFVDHGDRATVDATTSIYPITEQFITHLPFQAIECSLAGIEALDEESWDKAVDLLYDLTVDESNNAKIFDFKVFQKLPAKCTEGHKYSLALIDPNAEDESVLNKILVKEGLAEFSFEGESFLIDLPQIVPKDETVDYNEDGEDDFDLIQQTDSNISSQCTTVATLPTDDDSADTIKLSELKGVSVKALNQTEDTVLNDDESFWDFEIDDVHTFVSDMVTARANENKKKMLRALDAPVLAQVHQPSNVNSNSEENASANLLCDDYEDHVECDTGAGKKPNVTWYQDVDYVHISIELVDVTKYTVETQTMALQFSTEINDVIYGIEMNLFGAINPNCSEDSSTGRRICIKLTKLIRDNWPHLLRTPDKDYHWLKYDIEHVDDDFNRMTIKPNQVPRYQSTTSDLLADIQYNDSDSESGDSDNYEEEDRPFEIFDSCDPLN